MRRTDSQLAYTIEAATEATSLTRTRLYAAIADGSLTTFKVGRRRMVSAKALQQFVDQLESASAKEKAA